MRTEWRDRGGFTSFRIRCTHLWACARCRFVAAVELQRIQARTPCSSLALQRQSDGMPASASVSSLSASVHIAHVVQLSKKWRIMRSSDTSLIVPSLIVLRNKLDVSITEADVHVDVERSLQLLANTSGRCLISQFNHS